MCLLHIVNLYVTLVTLSQAPFAVPVLFLRWIWELLWRCNETSSGCCGTVVKVSLLGASLVSLCACLCEFRFLLFKKFVSWARQRKPEWSHGGDKIMFVTLREHNNSPRKRSWSSGRILACRHTGGPGSIPGICQTESSNNSHERHTEWIAQPLPIPKCAIQNGKA